MIDEIGRLRRLKADTEHSLKYTGTLWYVDGDSGADTKPGTTPDESFATIGAAITASAIGDRIYVMAATAAYDENGLDLNKVGLEIICEYGTVISNTNPGTVLVISASYARFSGAILIQAGQTALHVTGSVCSIEDIIAANCNVGFDIDGFANTFKNCKSNNHATTGFDISDDSNSFNNCIAVGDGTARGFHLSHANAGNNTFIHCQAANNGVAAGEAGYEVIVGADNNIFSFCSMSDGDQKVDAGANNTWSNFSEGSQIVAGQSRDQDLKDIYDDIVTIDTVVDAVKIQTDKIAAKMLFTMDFWSNSQEEVVVTGAQLTPALPSVTIADLPATATIVRAIAMFKFRIVENTNAAENSIDATAVLPIQVDDGAGTGFMTAIDFVDEMCKIAASTREGGDVVIGDNDIAARVDANDVYPFQWLNAKAHLGNLQFNDVQTGLRIWYSI